MITDDTDMIDLHMHTILSDGELVPSELVRRVAVMGYEAVCLTDHADSSNLDLIVPRIVNVARDLNQYQDVKVIPGVELTHLPPKMISSMVKEARKLGAALVLIHGESIAEPVATGTNMAGIEAGADIIAHPGLITFEEAALAAQKGIFLEISGRTGHSLTNGHVANIADKTGAGLVFGSDAHSPDDLKSYKLVKKIIEGAGLASDFLENMLLNSRNLLKKNRVFYINFSLNTYQKLPYSIPKQKP